MDTTLHFDEDEYTVLEAAENERQNLEAGRMAAEEAEAENERLNLELGRMAASAAVWPGAF